MNVNRKFVEAAEALRPSLHEAIIMPEMAVEVYADDQAFHGWGVRQEHRFEEIKEMSFGKDDSFTLDFGDHRVGYITLGITPVGSPPDAPLGLKLIFGEMPCEVAEPFDQYQGWLSRSWLQEETIYVDVLPTVIKLPRRYCFRYMKVIVLDTSRKYKVAFTDISCTTVTSADPSVLRRLPDHVSPELQKLDQIGVRTLADCMQTVFEDGPKRDRRLWIGDLRLQALASYYTFKNHDLVKRCLYLFAGMRLDGGEVGACVFEKPHPHVDDTLLYDYSLLFVATLYDYYIESRDHEALTELWPVAWEQLQIGLRRLDENNIVRDDPSWWCFIDWHPDLNKQTSAQAVLIYCLKRGLLLASALNLSDEQAQLVHAIEAASTAAFTYLWDVDRGVFISGADAQVSWASQIWMVLAEVRNQDENATLLEHMLHYPNPISMNTPYMYHHLIEALILSGSKERAVEQLHYYWGGMIEDGADCFWELYNPQDKSYSPYGSNLINSYCHAWSCTPTYFVRKYLSESKAN
ncbi:sugar hydrolase [Paenibacillus sp. Soil766]|uniref:alpha-L-rhamnosidase-related protein n=1 Tax=Paenibacillus sp. Soil766 TaxID=1736404 RepID=UPI00070E96C0|nr:family 78 glycoside hydrolase catalytic domain [Paenibacillus sp. Soil766]KRF03670.1 sugar hydrolase [Paenibacillus sp. Soil766]